MTHLHVSKGLTCKLTRSVTLSKCIFCPLKHLTSESGSLGDVQGGFIIPVQILATEVQKLVPFLNSMTTGVIFELHNNLTSLEKDSTSVSESIFIHVLVHQDLPVLVSQGLPT